MLILLDHVKPEESKSMKISARNVLKGRTAIWILR